MPTLNLLVQDAISGQIQLPAGAADQGLHFLIPGNGTPGVQIADRPQGDYLAALIMIGGRWIILTPHGDGVVQVNQAPIIGLKVLDHRDYILIGSLRLQFIAEVIEVLPGASPLVRDEHRCPGCKRRFQAGDQVIYCPRCELAHHYGAGAGHADCWRELKRCGSRPWCGYLVPQETTVNEQGS